MAEAVRVHLAAEEALLAPLDGAAAVAVAAGLRRLTLEHVEAPDRPLACGAAVATLAGTAERFRAVGQDPPAAGLLVTAVAADSAAAAEGLRVGDLLVSVDGVAVRGVADAEALDRVGGLPSVVVSRAGVEQRLGG